MSTFKTPLAAAVAGTLLAASLPAPAADSGNATLEEVIVTARKRAENLQDIPIAISAFNAATLDREQIRTTEDLSRITPNLQFKGYGPLTGNNSAAQVFIRGIGQSDASSGVDPGVGLYIDDVYMGRAVGGIMEFRDIANVQVLRGPQGTLFGRNTIGGAVLLSTQQPGDRYGGSVRLGVGSDSLYEGFGAVDLPFSETVAARFSYGSRSRDGYVTRVFDGLDLGNEHSHTAQGTVRFRPSNDFTLTVRGDYTKATENGSPFVFAAINERQAFPAAASRGAGCPGATFPPPSVPVATVDQRCANDATWNLGHYKNGGNAPAASDLENWGTSAVLEWTADPNFSLKSVSAYRDLSWSGQRDADNTGLLILHTDFASSGHQISQELQSLFTFAGLKGVVGAYYFKESYDDFLQVPFAAPPPLVASGAIQGSRDYQRAQLDNDNWAAFTQWTYDITRELSVTAGLRYTEETKKMRDIAYTITPLSLPNPAAPPTTNPPLNILPIPFKQTFDATTGSASIQYRWTPALMTYASWSQGFKSGGYNQRYNAAPPGNLPIAFDSEKAETYELGLKSEFGGDFRANAALFRTKYDDIQLTYRLGIVPLLFNAGKATIEGAELELTYAPGDLIVQGNLGYMDDHFDSITIVPGTTATVGPNNRLPFTPKWQGNVGVSYVFHTGAFLLTPHVDYAYTAKQFFDAANSIEVAQQDDVGVANASLSFGDRDDVWLVKANVMNLNDKSYPIAGNSSFSTSAGYAEIIYSRPRTYSVSLTYNFK